MALIERLMAPKHAVRKKRIMPTEAEVEHLDKQAWQVDGKGTAAWAMERLAALAEQKSQNNTVAAERAAAVNAWRDAENAKLQRSIDFFAAKLGQWHEEQFAADPKLNKSISLPDGNLKHRVGSVVTTVNDAEFLAWAEEHTDESKDLVKVTVAPVKVAIKNYVEATGEVLPGVKIQTTEDRFTIEPAVPGVKIDWHPFVPEEGAE